MTSGARTSLSVSWNARLRIRQWAHFLVLPLAGAGWPLAAPGALLRGGLISACVLAYGYLLNAVTDRESDLDPEKNPLLVDARQSFRVPIMLLTVAALLLSVTGPRVVVVATLVSLCSGWLYSAGPRLKSKPLIGTLLNATNFGPLLLVGASGESISSRAWSLMLPFIGLLLQNQLVHEAADKEEDQRGRTRTTFLALGRRGTTGLLLLVGLTTSAGLALVHPKMPSGFIAYAALSVLLMPLVMWRMGAEPRRMWLVRRIHRWLSAALGALLFFTA